MLAFLSLFACSEETKTATKEVFPREVLTEAGGYSVAYVPAPDPIPLNREFSIALSVYSADDTEEKLMDVEVLASAEMPEHDHGMPQEPLMEDDGNGGYTASGMLFQMSGDWDILVWVTEEGSTELAVFSVDCCE